MAYVNISYLLTQMHKVPLFQLQYILDPKKAIHSYTSSGVQNKMFLTGVPSSPGFPGGPLIP